MSEEKNTYPSDRNRRDGRGIGIAHLQVGQRL